MHYSLQLPWMETALGASWVMLVVTSFFLLRQRRANRFLKAANTELRRWQDIFEHAEWGVVVATADGGTLELMNPAFARMHGYTVDELKGLSIGEVFAPQSRDSFPAQTGNAREEGHHAFESWHRRKDGTVFPVFIDITTVWDPSRRVLLRIVNVQDITERKRAEEALVAREREFRTLAEHIPDHIIRYDAKARKVFMNTAAARLIGVDAGMPLGHTPEDTPTEAMAMKIDVFSEKLRLVLDTGDAQELEVMLRHATEGMQIHNIKFVAERDEQGKIVGALMVGRDMTSQKAAENELKERERRYREIFENVTDSLCLVEVTPEGRFRNLAFNFAFEQKTGMARESLIGIDVGGVAPEDGEVEDSDGLVTKYRRCLKAGSTIEEQTVLELSSGRRYFHSTLVPLYDDSGRVCRILGIAQDITERKRAEHQIRALNINLEQQVMERTAELRQQTRYLRTLVDSLPLLVWLKDTEGRFVMVNQATADSGRLSIEQMIGKSDLDLWPRETAETYAEEDREVMQTRRRCVIEKLLTREHRSLWIEVDQVPVLDDDGSVIGIVGVARNISERKSLEIARENALAEAIRLADLRSQFMARMSHELCTPLNGILGYAHLLRQNTHGGEHQNAMLNVIQESGEHLLQLINDILDFAKIEAGKQTLTMSDVPLRRFLHNLAGIVSVRAEQKRLAFRCDIGEAVPDRIYADEMRLRQVLLNLLSNAVKFSDRGCIQLRVMLEGEGQVVEIAGKGDVAASAMCRLRFQIQDSGIGIEAGQLENIFHPFEQVGDSRQGTGLGLAISRELVRLMGGEIRVSSRVGEGSIFWFDLDVVIVPGFGGIEYGADKTGSAALPGERAENPFPQAMDLPPPEDMEILYRFAREGSMRDIIRQADHLTQLGERYRPFADQLRTLASAYQSKAILELVSRYVDNPSDVS